MSIFRVGVLRGGPSSEYEISLLSGDTVLRHIPKEKYRISDILITKNGEWHIDGFPVRPEQLPSRIDVIFNAMHGEFGEDGQVQQVLDGIKLPYTGSRAFASSVGMNKGLAKQAFESHGLKTPKYRVVRKEDNLLEAAENVFHTMQAPFIVKPLCAGSSVGVAEVRGYKELMHAIKNVFERHGAALVEEFIAGRELTCAVVDTPEGGAEPLLPIEIVVPNNDSVWGYEAKYGGKTQEISPAELDEDLTRRIQAIAMLAHEATGMRHYSRSDFLVNGDGVWLLEINSLPGLTENSLLPKSLDTAGKSLPDFLDYIITLAISGK